MTGQLRGDRFAHLVDPWPFWAEQGEDDEGNLIEGVEELYLMEIVSPVDGIVWVSQLYAPYIMFRKDALDLETRPPTSCDLEHRPQEWNALDEPPCAVPTKARFNPDLIKPLLLIPGVKVLPLTTDDHAKPMAHAIVRGEDLIGYVMSRKNGGEHLPDVLLVPDRRVRCSSSGPS